MNAGRNGPGAVRAAKLLPLFVVAAVALSACGQLTQSTQQPVGDNARQILALFMPILWGAVAIFALVLGFLIYSVIRFRRRSENDPIPVQVHGDIRLEVLWTLVPTVIVVILAVVTFRTIAVQAQAAPPDALRVNVVGHQWWWEFEYPDLGITTANELRVPVGRTIDLKIESIDVIHSFWFPRIAGKIDAVPGRTNELRFTVPPDGMGRYQGQCAEFCGFAHAQMRMLLFAVSEQEFDDWAAAMTTPPDDPQGEAARGAEIFNTLIASEGTGCFICHTIDGTSAQGKVGPNLTGVANRTMIGAALLDNNTENLTKWVDNPEKFKPGVLMPTLGLAPDEISAVVAYLQSLK